MSLRAFSTADLILAVIRGGLRQVRSRSRCSRSLSSAEEEAGGREGRNDSLEEADEEAREEANEVAREEVNEPKELRARRS